MPVSTLDPKTALIVIDLQKGIVSLSASRPAPASSPRRVTRTNWDAT
jgi:nicotinamidase-related amidase